MIKLKESNQVRMDSWLPKLLPRDLKTKAKINQETNLKNNRKIKKTRKVKAMGNITPTMDQYPRNGQLRDTDP